MKDKDCERIANAANIHFSLLVDIFYDKHFKFNRNDTNVKAAEQIEELCFRN